MAGKQLAERVSLCHPRLLQPCQRAFKPGKDDGVGGGARLFILDRFRQFEHPAQGEQPVGARRRHAELFLQALGQPRQVLEESLIDDRLHLQADLDDCQRRLDIAAGKPLLDRLPGRRLDPLEARRQAQPRLDTLAIHRLYFPRDHGARLAGGRPCKAGHALQSHDYVPPSLTRRYCCAGAGSALPPAALAASSACFFSKAR